MYVYILSILCLYHKCMYPPPINVNGMMINHNYKNFCGGLFGTHCYILLLISDDSYIIMQLYVLELKFSPSILTELLCRTLITNML